MYYIQSGYEPDEWEETATPSHRRVSRVTQPQGAGYNLLERDRRHLRDEKVIREKIREKYIYETALARGFALDFTIIYMENIKELVEELDKSNRTKRTFLGYLLVLQSYVDYNGILRLNSQTHKPFNRSDITKVLKIRNRATSKEFIDLMLDIEVLDYIDTPEGKAFKLNNKYSLKGKATKNKYIKSFNEHVRRVYDENSASDVSFLFSLLPYVSYEDNVLAHNPYEIDPSQLDVLTTKDIADITGVSTDTVYRVKDRMMFRDMAVFKTETKNGLSNYVVNPLVVYRKVYEPDQAIIRTFKIKGK